MLDAYMSASVGGVLIGSAAVLLMVSMGKVMGMSGITWTAISSSGAFISWQKVFVMGVIFGAVISHYVVGIEVPAQRSSPLWLAALAGIIVGVGTKLGSGCTSGHGICGIGRLSKRSIVATLTFMATGIVTVALVKNGG